MKKVSCLFKTVFVAFLIFILYCFSLLVPYKIGSKFSGLLGRLLFLFAKSIKHYRYKIGIKTLGIAISNITPEQKNSLLKLSFDNFSRFIFDFFILHRMKPDFFEKNVTIKNWHIIDEAVARNEGIIFMTAHLGNWELMHKFFLFRHKEKMYTVYRPMRDKFLDKIYTKLRGTLHISKKGGNRNDIVRVIKNKKTIAVLFDQRNKNGENIKFFNQNALTSIAIEKLAIRYQSTLIPAKCTRDANDRTKFTIEIGEPLQLPKDPTELAADIMSVMEKWIIRHPDQWLWIHDRWKQ